MVSLFLLSAAAISLSLSLVFVGSLVPFGVISFSLVFFMCLLVGLLSSPWVGMIIFLVYVGGLMVMFAYFLAICPNQLIEFSGFRGLWLLMAFFMSIYYLKDCVVMFNPAHSAVSLGGLFAATGVPFLVLVAAVLFLTLVAVVKVVELRQGPLRPFVKREKAVRMEQEKIWRGN